MLERQMACFANACIKGAQRGQKRASGPVALELGVVMNHHVDAGNQPLASTSMPVGTRLLGFLLNTVDLRYFFLS